MSKKQKLKDDWIKETQLFQRIAKVREQSYEELEKIYEQELGIDKAAKL